MWTLYIIKCNDNTLYTGITKDLQLRLQSHMVGKGAKYTRGRSPFMLVYMEKFLTRANASKREYIIKKMSKCKKLSLIKRYKKNHEIVV